MLTYNKQTLSKLAQELGFIRDILEKMIRLSVILKFIADDPLLSKSIALKGGTAINLTIFNLPRLSIDIDLDFTHNYDIDTMMMNRKSISNILKTYMAAEGYELSVKSKFLHSLDSFVFTYINSAGIRDNIKIEINYSMRCHVLPHILRPIKMIEVFNETSVLSVAPIEIFASKIIALLTRTAARDLYDINNMLMSELFNEAESTLLRKCVIFYFTVASDEVPDSIDLGIIYSLTEHIIKTDLQPVLRKKERFDLAAAQLRVSKYLKKLFVLEKGERDYLDAFKRNEYKPELLFEEADIVERVRYHPMAMWKIMKKRSQEVSHVQAKHKAGGHAD
jgi:predicted nucleotidyltransferase component of viral defense system